MTAGERQLRVLARCEKANETETAREELRALLPPGSTVRTILRHVSASGMTRAISPIRCDRDLSYLAVRAVPGWKRNDRWGGITVPGAGMDMGFHLVYTLSASLYRDGFECIGEGCPSNDHSNGDRDYSPHHHANGGYALQQEWL